MAPRRRSIGSARPPWLWASLPVAGALLLDGHTSVCTDGLKEDRVRRAQTLLQAAFSRSPPILEISSHHAVLLSPSRPLEAGKGFAAEAFASLPRRVDGQTFTSTFTKFVVVGHNRDGPEGVTVGRDVCGAPVGITDNMATQYFRTEVQQQLSSSAPSIIECGEDPESCSAEAHGMEEQLAFLGALIGPTRSMQGNLLPLLLHGDSITLGASVGDALSLLVAAGGVWEAERVLFVLSGDLSEGLDAAQAQHCDAYSAEVLSQGGVPQAAEYFDALRGGQANHGCAGGAKAAPRGVSPIIAAVRLAERARLIRRRAIVGHDGIDLREDWRRIQKPPVIRGYAALLYWENSRSVWERTSAKSFLATTGRNASLRAAGRAAP
mmetsp:Transcript_36722/g.104493  ORF Transcript_36722/g.104493 Transcript_36722/m.104493 type:complete len:379 (+) Transcript_36722:100-1236(+)